MTSNRVPLIADNMPENTPSARRLGAQILGRTIAHMVIDWDTTVDIRWWPGNFATFLGFTDSEAWMASDAYLELLGA